MWDHFVDEIEESKGFFLIAAGISQVDTPAPGPADIGALTVVAVGCATSFGKALYKTLVVASYLPVRSTLSGNIAVSNVKLLGRTK